MAKPKLALIPSAQGTSLYSVLPSSGVGDFSFTRSGSATRINSQGLIETVGNGVSRLNYPMIDGVVKGCPHHILEPQRTQLIRYSEDFSNAYWIKTASTITSNATISPDGSLNADKLVENTENVAHITFASPTIILGNNTFSVFAKAAERRVLGIEFPSNGILVSFDLIDGVLVNSQANPDDFSITPYSNGWYRIDITENLTSSSVVSLSLRDDNGNRTYQGDGTSGIYIYGAMLESGSYSTSYIPNNGTSAGITRSAETANGSGDAATFNDSEGVFMVETSALANDLNIEAISINANNADNRLALFKWNVSNRIQIRVNIAGNTPIDTGVFVSNIEDLNKISLKYKSGDYALWINGFEVYVNSLADTPIGLSNLSFDSNGSNGVPFKGNTKQVQYFDTALNSEDLETLTSWVSFQDMAESQLYSIE